MECEDLSDKYVCRCLHRGSELQEQHVTIVKARERKSDRKTGEMNLRLLHDSVHNICLAVKSAKARKPCTKKPAKKFLSKKV